MVFLNYSLSAFISIFYSRVYFLMKEPSRDHGGKGIHFSLASTGIRMPRNSSAESLVAGRGDGPSEERWSRPISDLPRLQRVNLQFLNCFSSHDPF